MNKDRYLIHLIGVFYSFNYIIKESLFIEIIAKENFIPKFLVILLKLLYSLFGNKLSKRVLKSIKEYSSELKFSLAYAI